MIILMVRSQDPELFRRNQKRPFILSRRCPLSAPQDDQQVVAVTQAALVSPIGGSEDAFGPIPNHRPLRAALRPQPKTGDRQVVGERAQRQRLIVNPSASTTDAQKLFGQPQSFVNTQRHRR